MGNFMPKLNAAGTAWEPQPWEPQASIVRPAFNTRAARGAPSLFNVSTQAGGVQTQGMRWMTRAPFKRVRFHLANADTAAASGIYTILAAVSELGAAGTTPESRPTVGGVEYTALRASVEAPGWAPVLWAGASTKQVPIAPSTYNIPIVTSDWLTMHSVPRTDGAGYMLMLRYEIPSGNRSTQSGLTTATLPKVPWQDAYAKARPWWFEMDARVRSAGGALANLTLDLTTANNSALAIWPEYDYEVPAINVFAHGDSITLLEGTDTSNVPFGTWALRGCELATIAQGGSVVFLASTAAKGGTIWSEYSTSDSQVLAALPPGLFVHPVWSPNDGAPTATSYVKMLANLDAALALAKTNGHRVVTWAQLPHNGYTAPQNVLRLAQNDMVRRIAQDTGALDFLDFTPSIATVNPLLWDASLSVDGIHPNEAGVEAMGIAFGSWLSARYGKTAAQFTNALK